MSDCGTPKILQINSKGEIITFHKVIIPAELGDDEEYPPKPGMYRNAIVVYGANTHVYMYSSDGIPTFISNGEEDFSGDYEELFNKPLVNGVTLVGDKSLTDLGITGAISDAVGAEALLRSGADDALQGQINDLKVAPAFKPYPSTVITDGTTAQFISSIQALNAPAGTAYLGTVELNDLPEHLVQEEIEVYVYDNNTIYCVLRSADTSPYEWWCCSYNYQGWKASDTLYTAGNGLNLSGTEFSVDNTVVALQSDLPTKTSDLENDGADGTSTYAETDELPTATSDLTNDGDGESPFATQDYVDTYGGKIDKIEVNGVEQTITNKTVDITVPTKTSELVNDGVDGTSSYVEADDLATVATSGSYSDLSNKPTIGNATITIQKNGTSAGTFTTNATSNESINITVPTTAADVSALPASTKYGASLTMSINTTDYKVTTTLKDQDGNTLGSAQVVDLPLESVVVNGSYDSTNKKIVLTLQNGSTIDIPVGDLISGLQTEITSSNMLDADLVDDSTSTHKFTTASDISKLAGIAAGAEVNVQSDWNQATTTADDYIKNKPQLATVATSGSYDDLSNRPTIPTVNNATLTITQNGTSAGTFTANASSNKTISLTDTTYSVMTGAGSGTAGASGLVPAPAAGDNTKFLSGDGVWKTVSQYELPTASANTLGGVKVGNNLSIDTNGILSASASPITVDSALSTTSTNPVQNKVVASAINGKASGSITKASSGDLGSTTIDSTTANYLEVTKITTATDLDTIMTTGLYIIAVTGCTNAPSTNWGTMYVDFTTGTKYQLYIADGDYVKAWKRKYASNTWGDWKLMTPNDATLTIQKNGSSVGSFTANASSNVTANITVPTKTSDLTNDSSFATTSDVSTAVGDKVNFARFVAEGSTVYKKVTITGFSTSSSSVGAIIFGRSQVYMMQTMAASGYQGYLYEIGTDKNGTAISTNNRNIHIKFTNTSGTPPSSTLYIAIDSYASCDIHSSGTIVVADSNAAEWEGITTAASSIPIARKSDINNATLTIQKNGTSVGTFTANASSNVTANITVPDPVDYYWADVKVSNTSSTATTPTFKQITLNRSGDYPSITGNGSMLTLSATGTWAAGNGSLVLNTNQLRPSASETKLMDLGASNSLWKDIYLFGSIYHDTAAITLPTISGKASIFTAYNITPTADTTAAWKTALGGEGVYFTWYNTASKFTNQPSQYGFLRTTIGANDIRQDFWVQSGGAHHWRTGNGTGWYGVSGNAGVFIKAPDAGANIWYATCSTAAGTAAKVATTSTGGFSLSTGSMVRVKFTNANSYNGTATLAVDGTTAKNITRVGTTTTTRYFWNAGEIIDFVYDGTNFVMSRSGNATTTYYGVTKLETTAVGTGTGTALTPASLNSAMQGIIGYPVYSSSATYSVGDRVRRSYYVYECNTAITTAEAWDATHWTQLSPIWEVLDGKQDALVAGDHIDITNDVISAVDYVHSENPVTVTGSTPTVTSGMIADGAITASKLAAGVNLTLTLSTTDIGEGAALAANTLYGVYQ